MTDHVDTLAGMINTAINAPRARFVRGNVTTVTDATHCRVDLGHKEVPATVPTSLAAVGVGDEVRLCVQDSSYTVDSIVSTLGWVTSGITAASGWAVVTAAYRIMPGGLVIVACKLERTGSTITASGAGNFANTAIATLPAAIRPTSHPLDFVPFAWISTLCGGGGHLVPSTGVLTIDDMHSTGSVGDGDDLWFQVIYPL